MQSDSEQRLISLPRYATVFLPLGLTEVLGILLTHMKNCSLLLYMAIIELTLAGEKVSKNLPKCLETSEQGPLTIKYFHPFTSETEDTRANVKPCRLDK